MLLNDRKNILSKLGFFLKTFVNKEQTTDNELLWSKKLEEKIENAEKENAWFSKENILFAIHTWAESLSEKNIEKWLSSYHFKENNHKKIALILAGNIPLVGFHDFLCVLISGHSAIIKLSSNDRILLPFFVEYLQDYFPSLKEKIIFTKDKLTDFDAVIATGSDNTARYFEYYFGAKPHIIRKNRNSVAILTGEETEEDLYRLGKDIFTYFGLGCRSVSKIFVPQGYDFQLFFKAIYNFHSIIEHSKYANNYDYNKAVYLMSLYSLLENGFLILKEDSSYSSPIASLFYEYYSDKIELEKRLLKDKDKIQCIVNQNINKKHIPFGETQHPSLSDYADGVDTLQFLIDL
ncbi:MAG: acyl-CoA reductase [Capnocytophaga sp.]|nr:acyl-CoA reductase [Capnocytophaga sp.]